MSSSAGGGDVADSTTSLCQPDMSLGELFSELPADLGPLMRPERALARTEAKEELGRAGKAGALLAVGGLVAYLALLLASFALAWLLDDVMPRSLAFLIVAVLHGVVAAVLVAQGRRRLREVNAMPQQTMETLKEDAQ